MFLSIFTDELDGDFRESLPAIRSWGLERCDLRSRVLGRKLHDLGAAELAEVGRLLAGQGLGLGALESSLCKVHLPDAAGQAAERAKLEGIVRAADALGCRLVRAFNFWQPPDEEWGALERDPKQLQRVVEMFAPLAGRARAAGLTLAFENCGQTAGDALAVLDALNLPEWGLAWDPHITWEREVRGKEEFARIGCLVRRSKILHVKAQSLVPELVDIAVPWDRVLAACAAAGFAGPVSVETHNPEGSALSDTEASRRTVELLGACWPKAAPRQLFRAAAGQADLARAWEGRPVGFAVVGLGMGRPRSREMLLTPGCELVGVCDLDAERARSVGRDYGVPWSTDLSRWLSDERVEAVFCLTPTGAHRRVCLEALAAGKHAMTTKPMEASLSACDEMIAAADAAGRLLAVDFEYRSYPRVLDLKAAVEHGVFGRLLSATAQLKVLRTDEYFRSDGGWRGTRKMDGGGALSNQAIHNLDEIVYCLGAPDEVRCDVWTQNHRIEAEDLGIATWRYASGLVVTFYATTCFPQKTWYERLEIHGTEAAYARSSGGMLETEEVRWFVGREWTTKPPVEAEKPWLNSMDNLAAAIRTGAPLVCSGRDGRRSRAVLDAMYRSADNRGAWTTVRVEEPVGAAT